MNKLIIFDLDGTLTDSGPGIKKSIIYAYERMGKPIPAEKELESFIGPPLNIQFPIVSGFNEEETERGVHYFRERYNVTGVFENSVYPGIIEMLENLKKEGCTLAVATSKPHQTAEVVLEHFDLLKYFDHMKGADPNTPHADKTEFINDAIDKTGFSDNKENVYMVGDRKYDAAGAKSCGVSFLGAGWGYAAEGELEEFENEGIAKTPDELFELIVR